MQYEDIPEVTEEGLSKKLEKGYKDLLEGKVTPYEPRGEWVNI